MKKLLIFIYLCSIASVLSAQKKQYNSSVTQGNLLFMERNYLMALDSYREAYTIDSSSANINYKMGVCYLNIPGKEKRALRYLEKASTNISKNYDEDDASIRSAPSDAIYYHAKALHYAGNFTGAATEFEKYKKIAGNRNKDRTADISRQIEICNNAVTLSKSPEKINIRNMGDSINTEFPDYSPVVSADESMMLFTSRRPGSTGGERGLDGSYYEDIYISYRKEDGSWSAAKNLFSYVNTNTNEATIGLSPDGQKIYIYKDEDIYYSSLIGDTWSALTPFGEEVNSKHFEAHITMSADGNMLFFSSDRPGGLGGTDLYMSIKQADGKWGAPANLGPAINTPFNEDAPYIHPDGKKFFFASEGHNSMGGLDIFYTDLTKDATGNLSWSVPFSLGVPINTPDDDEFYVPSVDGKYAYFSSARENGKGDQDIYIAELPEKVKVDPLAMLKGFVCFQGDHPTPDNIKVTVFDAETNKPVAKTNPNSVSGKFILILNPGLVGKKYKVYYEATNFQPVVIDLDVPASTTFQMFEEEVVFDYIHMVGKVGGTMAVTGTVKDQKGAFIPGVKINIKDNVNNAAIGSYTTNSDSGSYYFTVNKGRNYSITYEAKGYMFQSQNVAVPKKSEESTIRKDVVLERIASGVKTTLNNIFFDYSRASLRKESVVELNTAYKMLKDNPGLRIEISGHTDSRGSDEVNQKLSEERAQSVVNYLVKKGIPASRLVAKGYGKAQSVAPNNLPDGKPDQAGMQKNRRVEMKVLSDGK